MKNILLFVMFVFVVFSHVAKASEAEAIDAQSLVQLLAWVETETGTKIPASPEVIANRDMFRAVLRSMGGSFAGRPQSAYLAGKVYLDDRTWDAAEPTQVSLLVHELVHHAQKYMTNVKWECPDAREAMAYRLQNKWLEQHGHNAFVQESWIKKMSACGEGRGGILLAQKE